MNVKNFSILSTFIVLVTIFSSCIFMGPKHRGNGNVTQEQRQVDQFHKLKVSRGMNVWITQGDTTQVVVVADENLHKAIITEVHAGTLEIFIDGWIRQAKENKVLITVKNLDEITVTAGSNVFSNSVLNYSDLDIDCSAGSNLTLEIDSKEVVIDSSSGSNVILRGRAERLKAKASSGSNLKAAELESLDCDAKASSGANVFVRVSNVLTAGASSGGNVFYHGNPQQKNTDTSSGGNIIQK